MWRANGNTTALLLFLASTFPKTRGYWKLKEEALDRPLRELSLEEAMNLSQDRLRNE